MSTDKEKLIKGLYHLAFAFPFIFAGPSLFAWRGADGLNSGNYGWTIVSLICMLVAIFLIIRGIKVTLNAFFQGNN